MELNQYPKAQTLAQQYKALFTGRIAKNFSIWERIYTDGSKSAEGVGAATVWGEVVRDKALPQQTSIYTAEVCGMKLVMNIINENNIRRAVIFTDSCSAATKMETVQFEDQVMRQLQHQIYANRRTGHQILI